MTAPAHPPVVTLAALYGLFGSVSMGLVRTAGRPVALVSTHSGPSAY